MKRVIPPLDEHEARHPGVGLGSEARARDELALERREEALAHGVGLHCRMHRIQRMNVDLSV